MNAGWGINKKISKLMVAQPVQQQQILELYHNVVEVPPTCEVVVQQI